MSAYDIDDARSCAESLYMTRTVAAVDAVAGSAVADHRAERWAAERTRREASASIPLRGERRGKKGFIKVKGTLRPERARPHLCVVYCCTESLHSIPTGARSNETPTASLPRDSALGQGLSWTRDSVLSQPTAPSPMASRQEALSMLAVHVHASAV